MKQGKVFMRVITAIFFVAVLCYVAYAVIDALRDPLTTSVVIEYEAGEACFTTGYVMRDESVLASRYPITVITRSEGERVGAGQAVAVGYQDSTAQQRQSEIDELNLRLEQLEYAYSSDLEFSDIASLESNIVDGLTDLAQSVNRRDFSSASSTGLELKSLVLRRYSEDADSTAIRAEIAEIEAQLAQLSNLAGSDTRAITVTSPGYFSGTVDGYESILDPDKIEELTVDYLKTLEENVQAVGETVFCRLITENIWYYATVVSTDYAAMTYEGDTVAVTFSQDLYDQINMTVEMIGAEEDGRCVLVLSCDRYLTEVTLLRHVSADIVFSSYSGLRVPKSAIRLNDNGEAGVYILEGTAARWKNVTILYDNGESYVVKLDKSDTDNLWPGDEVIVNAKGLYNGKVVTGS